jgi:glycosyltransferase involved in cell wall biosynthesis
MITIGYCTKKIDPKFKEYIEQSCGVHKMEVIPFENPGTHSLSEAYNIILEKASNDIVVLCHDDLYFEKKNWGNKVLKHFKRNPEYGILGVAGTKFFPKSARWWEITEEMLGIVNHQQGEKKWTNQYSESKGSKLDETVIVDGLFIALDKTKIKHTFDESFDGFHFYDLGFSFKNHISGVKVGVFYDVRITHLSIGQTNNEWESNRLKFLSMYEDKLPILLPTKFNKKPIKKGEPLVTLAMPIYNYAKRLNPTLQSVYNQDYTNFEITLVNDGSNDEYCLMKLDSLEGQEGIRIIHKENTGVSDTRNVAVREGKGEYILPLDADDMIYPGYLKTGVNIIKKNPKISPVYCDTVHVGEMQGLEKRPEWSKERLLQGPFIVNSSMYSREAYNSIEGYNTEMKGWVDYDLWVQMMDAGFIGKRIPKGLFIYFHHESEGKGSVSTSARQNMGELHKTVLERHKKRKNNSNE